MSGQSMEISVGKTFTFHAAHFDALATDQCADVHGHTFKLEIEVSGYPHKDRGMLIHGNVLKEIYRTRIEPHVEHRALNETLPVNPTMENTTAWLLQTVLGALNDWPNIRRVKVRLWETPTMYAEACGTTR